MKHFIAILFIATLFSCQYRSAREFNALLDSTDRKVYRILAGDSVERNRLEALVARKPDVALHIGKKQAGDLRSIILEIDNTDVRDINDANQLKKSTTNYYKAMFLLKQLDILEAQLMAVTLQNDTEKAKRAGMDISNLISKRLKLHKAISDCDQARQNAKSKFLHANHIR